MNHGGLDGHGQTISSPPYRILHTCLAAVKEEVIQILKAGLSEQEHMGYTHCAGGKNDGSLRLCMDYRKLNAITHPDLFPMPRVEDLIHRLADVHFITTLDLTKRYWQVPVAKGSQEKKPLPPHLENICSL